MKRVLLYFFFVLLAAIGVIIIFGYTLSAPGYKGEAVAHFNGSKFTNSSGAEASGFSDLIKWLLNREQGNWTEVKERGEPRIPENRIDDNIHITYINHATFLIQSMGKNVITDPIFSDRASPFSWAGPARMRPPGIALQEVPPLDVVIISHNHYDHLDRASVENIHRRDNPLFVVPLGVGGYLEGLGISRIIELDWWQEHAWEGISVQSVPAQHFSGRGMFDRDKTLWSGYMLRSEAGLVYFAGDTGYDETMFREIGSRAGNPDIALIPIGAYKPEWFMSPIHVSPAEAVRIHEDVKAQVSIAMHYGTFPLADEGQFTPLQELDSVKRTRQTSPAFIVLPQGQRYTKD